MSSSRDRNTHTSTSMSRERTVVDVQYTMVTMGGGPSARLFGRSAADWSWPATNKSISSERKKTFYCSAEKGNHEKVGC